MGRLLDMLREVRVSPDAATSDAFRELGEPVPNKSLTLEDVLRRPSMTLERLERLHPGVTAFPEEVLLEAETSVKYAGYLVRQDELVKRSARLEEVRLPADLDYPSVSGLSAEIVEKLCTVRPRTLGQAGRISGAVSYTHLPSGAKGRRQGTFQEASDPDCRRRMTSGWLYPHRAIRQAAEAGAWRSGGVPRAEGYREASSRHEAAEGESGCGTGWRE